jgi:hypothetical protein
MTDSEALWLSGTDPNQLLGLILNQASARKLRLFACAASRRLWHLLGDERSRQAVEVSERYADGFANPAELHSAAKAAEDAMAQLGARVARPGVTAAGAIRIGWNPAQTARMAAEGAAEGAQRAAQAAADVDLMREIFGNPFRPVAVDPAWVRWNDGCLVKMARAIYEERRFSDLPILADALEEAGCDNTEILAHCRLPGWHYRGCWVVDALLDKK